VADQRRGNRYAEETERGKLLFGRAVWESCTGFSYARRQAEGNGSKGYGVYCPTEEKERQERILICL